MPSDVFESLWAFVEERIETGDIAVTREIYEGKQRKGKSQTSATLKMYYI